ncbi:MAG: hypothetical protein Q8N23_17475 [Archangium sp.]|nr:hypothetical protein [Archangium sp.]MDP3154472.1 hypothetical protein [Archangium sp.]MDP3572923.1 hypothetical protein [Archangium sp.]
MRGLELLTLSDSVRNANNPTSTIKSTGSGDDAHPAIITGSARCTRSVGLLFETTTTAAAAKRNRII